MAAPPINIMVASAPMRVIGSLVGMGKQLLPPVTAVVGLGQGGGQVDGLHPGQYPAGKGRAAAGAAG